MDYNNSMSDSAIVWWPRMCGKGPLHSAFWSSALTWNTQHPVLTDCLLHTVLDWLPCAFLCIAAPIYVPYLCQQPQVTSPAYQRRSKLNKAKLCVGLLQCLLCLVSLVYQLAAMHVSGQLILPVHYVTPLVEGVSLVTATALSMWEYRKGVNTSGVLWIFWFILFLVDACEVGTVTTTISLHTRNENIARVTMSISSLCLTLVIFALHNVYDLGVTPGQMTERSLLLDSMVTEPLIIDTPTSKHCPELTASFLRRICITWITGLVIRGYRKVLTRNDLFDLREDCTCQYLMQKMEGRPRDQKPKKEPEEIEPKVSAWSLGLRLLKALKWDFAAGGMIRLVGNIAEILCPLVLGSLLRFLAEDSPYVWHGVLQCIGLLVISILVCLMGQMWMKSSCLMGMYLRTIVNTTVYNKALSLPILARSDTSVGKIVNLMSVDAKRIEDMPIYAHTLWATPIKLALCMLLLYQTIGVSCVAGVALALIVIALNGGFVGQQITKMQEEQMMHKDNRIRLVGQILSGIKALKFYAWETSFEKRVNAVRENEMRLVSRVVYVTTISATLWTICPYLMSCAVFSTYILLSPHNVLGAERAFVSLSLINTLATTMFFLPAAVSNTGKGIASLQRLARFLNQPERKCNQDLRQEITVAAPASGNGGPVITIKNGYFSWFKGRPTLKGIDLQVPEGKLVAVVGEVGSGKSSLISAILGEIDRLSGYVSVHGTVAYVPQQAWIQNATLQGNILYKTPLDSDRYQRVLTDGALLTDLALLPGGDQTEIGEKGVNLSGGQKHRVSLARAVYQDRDIYLLDDPLSAVDAHVGKHLFEQVIGPDGVLKSKTRILVTHVLSILPQVDHIIVMSNGRIVDEGPYEKVTSNGRWRNIIQRDTSPNTDEALSPGPSQTQESDASSTSLKRKTGKSGVHVCTDNDALNEDTITSRKLIKEEVPEMGALKLDVMKTYAKATGTIAIIAMLTWKCIFIASLVCASNWLSEWTNDPVINGTSDPKMVRVRLGVYACFGGLQLLALGIESLILVYGCLETARTLHRDVILRLLRAPMSFFETTPLGRITNRLTRDVDMVDTILPLNVQLTNTALSQFITGFVIIVYTTPTLLAAIVPIIALLILLQRVLAVNIRQVTRMDSILRSPILSHLEDTLTGISSIRAYGRREESLQHCDKLIDESQKAWFIYIIMTKFIVQGGQLLCIFLSFLSALMAVIYRDSLTAGLAGMSVASSMQLSMIASLIMYYSAEIDGNIVAAERIREYTEIPQEAPWRDTTNPPDPTWPREGRIRFRGYGARYRPGLSLVLRDLNMEIQPKEKVAIVGRTGAGKSSLTLALFRIIPASTGTIDIDGVLIDDIGLHDLRSKLSIIPQDPVLFSGTLRSNLDPLETCTDPELWKAIARSHLGQFVEAQPMGLGYQVGEKGEALSAGQRQLVCLARALLRNPRILVLDEATAAVDQETDKLIQRTIREQFQQSTVITIAHRINTIMDSDRVFVFDSGTIQEAGTPQALLSDSSSAFYKLSKDAGINIAS